MRRFLVVLFLAVPLYAQTDFTLRGATRHPGKVIVEFRDPPLLATSSSPKTVAAAFATTVNRLRADVPGLKIRYRYFRAFNGVSATASGKTLERIRALPYVKAVHPDLEVKAHGTPDAPSNVKQVGAPDVWSKYGTRGAGIVVAIIDTGIDYTHPAISDGIGPGHRVIGGHDFYNDDDDPLDDNGHGTHVAGIVGAKSDKLLGVAPDVSFLAFKVLSAEGSGTSSEVLAGIEAAVDPNGDGDTRDHADVANMSLGGPGGPDDLLSRAVDTATSAGVVFCISAGNSGTMHSIGSPGTARTAITVGAVDAGDYLAPFSSRGPNMKDLAVKPDVVAPGVAIESAYRGGTAWLSGTSMAAPHVTGVAALLRAIHRDWTPVMVKSAIVSTAVQTRPFAELMSYGNGRVDALAAAGATLVLDPPLLTFGLDTLGDAAGRFKPDSRVLRLRNPGTQALSLTLTPRPLDGVTVTITPATVDIPAGGATDVTVAIDADNSTVAPRSTAGGTIDVAGLPAPAHFAWGFTKSSRLTVTYDGEAAWMMLYDPKNGTNLIDAAGENIGEALVAPGSYDLILFGVKLDQKEETASDATLFYRTGLKAEADDTIAMHSADARRTITFAGRDERGALLRDSGTYVSFIRIDFPPGAPLGSGMLPVIPGIDSLRVADFGGMTLRIGEADGNMEGRRITIMQHEPLPLPLAADTTLSGGGAGLIGANVRLFIPKPKALVVGVFVGGGGYAIEPTENVWFTRVAMMADSSGFSVPFGFIVIDPVGSPYYEVPWILPADGKITSAGTPWHDFGAVLTYGFGPVTPKFRLTLNPLPPDQTWSSGQFENHIVGPLGEVMTRDEVKTKLKVTDGDGNTIVDSLLGALQMEIGLGKKMVRHAELTFDDTLAPDIPRKVTTTLTFDNRRSDFVAPTFTAVMLLDQYGNMVNEITPHAGGSLEFSAADYINGILQGSKWQPIRGEATQVSYRYRGTSTWMPLTAVQIAQDPNTKPLQANAGVLYRVDLKDVAKVDDALVDMKIDLTDVAGNTATLLMEPAFAVRAVGTIRHRASGR